MRTWFLGTLAHFSRQHPKLVLGVAVVLTLISAALASTLELKLSFVDQLPDDSQELKLVDYANENFGGMDLLYVVLRGEDKEALAAAATSVADELTQLEGFVSQVLYRIDLAWFRQYGLLFAEVDDLKELAERVEAADGAGPPMRRLFSDRELASVLGDMGDLLQHELVDDEAAVSDDPDGAADVLDGLLELVEAAGKSETDVIPGDALASLLGETKETHDRVTWAAEGDDGADAHIDDHIYFLNPDRDGLLLLVRPPRQDYDYAFSNAMMAAVEKAVKAGVADHPGVSFEFTGNTAVMREENEAITQDMGLTTGVALVGILLLFLWIFRRPAYIVIVGLPLVMSVVWTFGFVDLVFGSFNIVTAIFAPILLGLGIDFAIHLTARYQEERLDGRSAVDAAETSVIITGQGLLTGGFTTSAAFLVMATARYKGMSQMGIVAGAGILLAMFAMLTMVPAFLTLVGDRLPLPTGKPAGMWIGKAVARVVMAAPGATLVVAFVITAGLGFSAIRGLEFDYDMRALDPAGMPSIEAMKRIEEEFEVSVDYGLLLADDADEERRMVSALEKMDTVGSIESAQAYLPENQAEKLPLAKTLSAVLKPPAGEALDGAARAAAIQPLVVASRALVQVAVLAGSFEVEDRARRLAEEADALARRLAGGDTPGGYATLDEDLREERRRMVEGLAEVVAKGGLTAADLPDALKANYLGRDGKRLVYAYPTQNVWHEQFMARHVGQIKEVGEGEALGVAVVFYKLISDVMADFEAASIYSLLAVIFFLFIDFKNPIKILLALVPLLVGSVWMLGVMPLFGLTMNYVNVAIVPIVLGIGIDDGVHMLHRYLNERSREQDRSVHACVAIMVHQTGRAVLLTSLTTMIGFGAVGLATHRGLASLGYSVSIGIFACYVAAVTMLPAMLVLGSRGARPEDESRTVLAEEA